MLEPVHDTEQENTESDLTSTASLCWMEVVRDPQPADSPDPSTNNEGVESVENGEAVQDEGDLDMFAETPILERGSDRVN